MVVTLSALTHVGRSMASNTFITKVSEVKSTLIVSVKYIATLSQLRRTISGRVAKETRAILMGVGAIAT